MVLAIAINEGFSRPTQPEFQAPALHAWHWPRGRGVLSSPGGQACLATCECHGLGRHERNKDGPPAASTGARLSDLRAAINPSMVAKSAFTLRGLFSWGDTRKICPVVWSLKA